MLTKITISNFKRFAEAEIELGKSVVFIGPNNSGKTSALQALALWNIGLNRWIDKRSNKTSRKSRPGVTINRHDLIAIPMPAMKLLWLNKHVRDAQNTNGSTRTSNVRINITAEGITNGKEWICGLEFDYSNEESFYCRPLRLPSSKNKPVDKAEFSTIPDEARQLKIAYLPPMSGLSDREFVKERGEIEVLIGQGQTAQILRNLCYRIFVREDKSSWDSLVDQVKSLFGVTLLPPNYIQERSEIVMEYRENGTLLDLSSSGRGLQQILLLLAYLHANPDTVLLLDEPDAHLEILRQREIYNLLTDAAEQRNSQIIAASHSEVVLNEAVGRGKVIAFVGRPHVLNNNASQLIKSLNSIGWDQYYQAKENGWVLYLEGPSDLAILQTFAETLKHNATKYLKRPFVHYIGDNTPQIARNHFFGLKEADADLKGIAIFDRLEKQLHEHPDLSETMWKKREIENYFCCENVLLAWANHDLNNDLFARAEAEKRENTMKEVIAKITELLVLDDKSPWSDDVKATDEVLDRIFREFFKRLELPLTFRKTDYYQLAKLVPENEIDAEIREKLDAIVDIANRVKRAEE